MPTTDPSCRPSTKRRSDGKPARNGISVEPGFEKTVVRSRRRSRSSTASRTVAAACVGRAWDREAVEAMAASLPSERNRQDTPMAATILVTDFAWPSLAVERDVLAGLDADLLVAETGEPDELVALAPQADAILVNWKQLPPEALDAAPRCLVVSRYGIGVDNIPVERATELGIVVANVPDFCVDEVSDHALALLLACSRKLAAYSRSTRAGEWDVLAGRPIARLRGQLLGLVGNG